MVINDADPNSDLMSTAKQMDELHAFAFIEPGSRLVEQELRWACAERNRYAQSPQMAEWHCIGYPVGERFQADKLQKPLW